MIYLENDICEAAKNSQFYAVSWTISTQQLCQWDFVNGKEMQGV